MLVVNSKLVRFHANDLLDHRVIQSGKFVPSPTVSVVEDAILEITEMMNWNLQNRNLKIDFIQEKEETHHLSFDKRRLQQVLLNLLSNAIKFSDKGTIEVNLKITETKGGEDEVNYN